MCIQTPASVDLNVLSPCCPLYKQDQLRRYIEVKQSDFPPAVAARKTREFRCPPTEQMRAVLAFRKEDLENDDPTKISCPCSDAIRNQLLTFHGDLLSHSGHPEPEPEDSGEEEVKELTWTEKLLALIKSKEEVNEEITRDEKPGKWMDLEMFLKERVCDIEY